MIGPLNLDFKKRVLQYFSSSPSPNEKECLKNIFLELQKTGIQDSYLDFNDGRVLIAKCGHIIELFIKKDGSGRVSRVYAAFQP